MARNSLRLFFISIHICACARGAALRAQGAGREAYPFLKIPVSARAAGMGEVSAATSEGVESLYHNPAGLSLAQTWQFSSFNLFSSDLYRIHHVAGLVPVDESGALAVGAMSLSHPAIEKRDKDGNSTGNFEASDVQVNLGYSHQFGTLRLGAAGKLLRSQIDTSQSQRLALDMGLQKQFGGGIVLGAALLNTSLQSQFEKDPAPLPAQIRVGLAIPFSNLLVGGEMSRSLLEDSNLFNFGAEWKITISKGSQVSLRGGYLPNAQTSGAGASMKGLSTGLGCRVGSLSVDYATGSFTGLGREQRFSVGWAFGQR